MTTPAVDAATRRAAHAWLTRFSPAIVLWEKEGSLWVTDKIRAHRVPEIYRQLLDTAVAPELGTLEVHWDQVEDEPSFTTGPDWSLTAVTKWRPTSARLHVVGIDHRSDQVQFLTNDLEPVRMSLNYYQQARLDGTCHWQGRDAAKPIYGCGDHGQLLCVVMPLAPNRGWQE